MIEIVPFEKNHVPALADMLTEMTRFYGATISPNMNVEAQIIEQAENMDMLLALHERRLVGFATFKTLFPVGGLLSFTDVFSSA
jgi:hypothetical protein